MVPRSISRRRALATGVAALGSVVAGCSGREFEDPPTGGEDEVVEIAVGPDGDAAFRPESVEILPEATVRWVWESDGHTVVPVSAPDTEGWTGVTEPRDAGYSFEESFEVVGTYEYRCDAHGSQGAVVVESA